jgi:hypothetical protein
MQSLCTHCTLTMHALYTHYARTIHSLCTHYTLTMLLCILSYDAPKVMGYVIRTRQYRYY